MSKYRIILTIVLLTIGTVLIGINIVGLFKSLRNNEIYEIYRKRKSTNNILLTQEQVLRIASKHYKSTEQFIINVNHAVHNGVLYYWDDEGTDKYNLRVPWEENYILHLASYIYPNVYKKYEFTDFNKNLERGVGLCGTQSKILAGLLTQNHIPTKIVNLKRHVLTMVLFNKNKDIWYLVDPTLDIIIKEKLNNVIKHPEIVKSYYDHDYLVELFKKKINITNAAYGCQGILQYSIEKLSYIGIWIFPIILFFGAYWINTRI